MRPNLALVLCTALLALSACTEQPVAPSNPLPAASPAIGSPEYVPGQSYFGDNGYIEYVAGDLPVIFTAPHGGALQPASIPLRAAGESCGPAVTTVRDANTEELVRAIRDAFFARTGGYPHIVINRLHRNRLDANREIVEAACGNAEADEAWRDFHEFVDGAKQAIVTSHGRGFFTDIHGHGHTIQRLELGYELTGTRLRNSDAQLDATATAENLSSIRTFSQESPLSFSAALRGPTALGTWLTHFGYPSVPSAQDPAPALGQDYFSGGYNTDRHACSNGGSICGVQIEANMTGVRDNAANRASFAAALAAVYPDYLTQFGVTLPVASHTLPAEGAVAVVDHDNANNDLWTRFGASSEFTNGSNMTSWRDNNFRLHSGTAATGAASFLVHLPAPGSYAVDAWWPAASTRSATAPYQVYDTDGITLLGDHRMSQQTNGARWNRLGTYTFARAGWARVTMARPLSGSGSLAADAVRFTTLNAAPTAIISGPATVAEGSAITLSGATSTDPDGDALAWTWAFSDGVILTGAEATRTFANDGAFSVTLTVTDRHGASASATRAITVTNVAPVATIAAGAVILQGETYHGSGTFTDPGADMWTATVEFGDGSGTTGLALDGKTFTLEHRYAVAGTFTVGVTVTDGAAHGTGSASVVVRSPAEGLDVLIAQVRALSLRQGETQSLLAKLQAAGKLLDRENGAAAQVIAAFVNELDALVRSGRLTAAAAEPLAAYARRLIASIEG
ncbi:MAG: PKD domain-containing protein [Gemmatimonadaceae bacterium]|nr:PKD domain-containing protein [Gemmatimonadaceae bacterium]